MQRFQFLKLRWISPRRIWALRLGDWWRFSTSLLCQFAGTLSGSSHGLEGQRLAGFTGVAAFVRNAFEEALSGILNKRAVDVLLDIKKSQVSS